MNFAAIGKSSVHLTYSVGSDILTRKSRDLIICVLSIPIQTDSRILSQAKTDYVPLLELLRMSLKRQLTQSGDTNFSHFFTTICDYPYLKVTDSWTHLKGVSS